MMKKLLLFFVFISFVSQAQIGIGTTAPDPSSMLDIRSSNTGLLIPRVNLTSTSDNTTISNPALSLMVYNLSAQNDIMPGFYFWQGGTWRALSQSNATASPTSGWSLSGNNLTSGNEFLGSTNYQPLNFRVNNQQVGRIHPNGGIAFGNGALANDNNSIAIGRSATSSSNNEAIAIGPSANASGFRSTAIGMRSVASNNNTLALGYFSSASGFQSTGIGVSSLSNTNNSLAIGNSSRATGQQATALGTEANSSGQNATAIGYQAIATQANSIILGSSANTNNRVGIGTNTPDERLHINGSIKIVDGTQGAGRVLTSDANGRATWTTPTGIKAFANIYATNNQTRNYNQNVVFDNTNASFNVTTNSDNIQITNAGTYKITYTVTFYENNHDDAFRFGLFTTNNNNSLIPGSLISTGRLNENDSIDKALTVSNSVIVNLNELDRIFVRCLSSGNNNNGHRINLLGNACSLSVELLN